MKQKASNRKNKKPAFYSKVLSEAEKLDFEQAAGIEGIDDEITILRMKIACLLEKDPENIRLLMAADEMLTKMVKARYKMTHGQKAGLKEAIKNVIKDVAVPIGVALLKK